MLEAGHTVLLVDDDAYLRVVASMELPGVELIEAGSIHEALEVARATEPDAVLVDRRLPDGDGLDLVRQLREIEALARVPVLVITAGHDEAHRIDVLRAGADEYLAKPFEPADLLARLERVLAVPPGGRRQRRLSLIQRLQAGITGDPDPLPPPPAPTPRRRGLFRRR